MIVIYKVQEVLISGEKKYMLLDSNLKPIVSVTKYLKYLDNTGRSTNTIKSYCYHLKLYYEFLGQKEITYTEVDLNILAEFIGWLRSPNKNVKVINLNKKIAKRRETTINTIIDCVVNFYDYLFRLEEFEESMSDKTKKQISSRHISFKSFLHHISENKQINKNILKLKEPKRKIKTLTTKEIEKILSACSNIRDELLLRILYEGGLRIGEVLSLWIEDFDMSSCSIRVRKSKTSSGEGRKVFVSEDTMNLFQDYLIDIHDSDTDFVFINITGQNKGQVLKDTTVRDVIKRISKKTNIEFTPHMLRHTFATELHENGTEISVIQKLLGHANVQTTIQTYLHLSDEFIRKSYEKAQEKKAQGDERI